MTSSADTNAIIIKTGEAIGTLASITENLVASYSNGTSDLLDTIGGIRLLELAAAQARQAVVTRARAEGYTWQEIADTLGTTRQNAQQRFGTGTEDAA